MKKLVLLAMLLGLTGCGDNNQSDTTQTSTQASTLQKAEVAPAVANYNLAVSPRAMGAVAPLQGWGITQSTVMGASTLIDAIKDTKVSAALVTPNAKQVAEVLRGGAAGIALSIAIEQLLGAVDWVLDPANNQIKYKPVTCKNNPSCLPNYKFLITQGGRYYPDGHEQEACRDWLEGHPSRPGDWKNLTVVADAYHCKLYGKLVSGGTFNGNIGANYNRVINNVFDPNKPDSELPLETVAEQVISNADAGSLDAQVATNIAAQNILNDEELAKPVVQELENNARDKDPRCKAIIGEMERLAIDVEFRYNDLLLDRHDLYRNYRSIKNAHWSYGSWDGHIKQYNIVQGKLKDLVTKAVIEGCTVSTYVRKWSEEKPPTQPLPKG